MKTMKGKIQALLEFRQASDPPDDQYMIIMFHEPVRDFIPGHFDGSNWFSWDGYQLKHPPVLWARLPDAKQFWEEIK